MKLNTYTELALAGLISLYAAGCGKRETPRTQQTQPPVSQTLEQKAEKKEISDEVLFDLYKKSVEKSRPYYQKIEEALSGFAKRSGYKDIGDITDEDYKQITVPILREMRKDPDIKPIYESWGKLSMISGLANQNIDMGNIRRENDILYGKRLFIAFSDPELTIPHGSSSEDLSVFGILVLRNPRVYKTSSGKEAVQISENMWTNIENFDKKPGQYARAKLQEELMELQFMHAGLSTFLTKIKPSNTTEDLQKLLEKESNKVSDAVYDLIRPYGEGEPQNIYYSTLYEKKLTPEDLQKGKKELEEAIVDLKKVLSSK